MRSFLLLYCADDCFGRARVFALGIVIGVRICDLLTICLLSGLRSGRVEPMNFANEFTLMDFYKNLQDTHISLPNAR